MLLMRYCSHRFPIPCEKRLTNFSRRSWLAAARGNLSCSFAQNGNMDVSLSNNSTFSGMEDVLMGYIFGKEKATKVAHLVWKHVVQKGDTVVDATCGNGYDTLAMLKMVADGSGRGCVYGMDIQKDALENTSSLLNESVNPIEKELVKLFTICHSRMEEVVPKSTTLRLVAFNLGYLPGGDKEVTTTSATTILALQTATRILASGGLISLVVYVGHPGGRDELETIQAFASELSVEDWVCSEFQMLNRPLAPVLIFLFKR
ncbi:putative rRNA methylase YtqB [Vitis riparia]|uniref:putative rRNA methylase YtqB n=1 Tax=Vitis riparia TaxID=96939 RepID=UPI00155A4A1B|nr:putative rRNA methylase YtqB [Vitis riparia]